MKKFGNVLILGDSYSTFDQYIPDGYGAYYGEWASKVNKVEKTWWHMLIGETASKLVTNESFSGTTVCNTGYDNNYCPDTSFVGRFLKYADENGMDGIDTVFIFGGTNDCWAGSPLGTIKYEGISDEDLKSFLPAFSYLIAKIREKAPEAEIVDLINCDLSEGITKGQQEICSHYKVHCITLENIDKEDGHPTDVGMIQIKDAILAYFK